MDCRIVWCLGMYASASTWAFNVVRQIREQSGGGKLQTAFFGETGDVRVLEAPGQLVIVKSHEIANEALALAVAAKAHKILVTMRDPRDAMTSMMLYHGYAFERALPLVEAATRLCMGFAQDSRALLLHYESGFHEDPGTLSLLASYLGDALAAGAAQRIFAQNQRQEVEKYIAGLPKLPGVLQDRVSGDRLDPRTHWHSHHAGRSGEAGRWRHKLVPEQAAEVERRLADCYAFAA